jgi:lysophospholipase L1-like esterase
MINILCYGDSNTYGLSPDWINGNMGRHDISVRWTGRLQKQLGESWRIIEEGLNGRTTVFDDPTFPGRNGLKHLRVCLESHSPLDGVIIMLGTNDTKPLFNASTLEIATGLGRLIQCVLNPFTYIIGSVPKVLVAAPVPLGPEGAQNGDESALIKSAQLAEQFEQTAKMYGCEFIDLGKVAHTAKGEGVHLDPEGHAAVANAFEQKLRQMFE